VEEQVQWVQAILVQLQLQQEVLDLLLIFQVQQRLLVIQLEEEVEVEEVI
jgi:hypothetical protein